MKRLPLLTLLLCTSLLTSAQNFTVIDSLPKGQSGAAAWGDYDNDGRIDLAYAAHVTPNGFLNIYHNTPAGFVKQSQSFSHLYSPSLHWADLDKDGRMDLIASGYSSSGVCSTYLYKSNGNGTFTDVTPGHIPGLSNGSMDVTDYNNDTWPDIVVTGLNDLGVASTIILKGAPAFSFTNILAPVWGGGIL